MRLKWNLEGYFPVGKKWQIQLDGIFYGYILSVSFSVIYYAVRLSNAYWRLFGVEPRRNDLPPKGFVMEDFGDIVSGAFISLVIFAIIMIFLIVNNYRYHHQGSQSIYLMKRLPKKHELQKRCIVVPLAGILASVLTAVLLLALYYLLYFLVTPEQCLAPGQWQKLWS